MYIYIYIYKAQFIKMCNNETNDTSDVGGSGLGW